MKVIFLDFDGVVNNWYNDNVSEKNVSILKKIVDTTDAKIVVTSSNKYVVQLGQINYYDSKLYKVYIKKLNTMGIEVHDFTPYIKGDRNMEISEYLKSHPEITQFLILDDDYIFQNFLDHQVFLDWYRGLLEEHVEYSVNILNGKLGFYPLSLDLNETVEQRIIRINKYYNHLKK